AYSFIREESGRKVRLAARLYWLPGPSGPNKSVTESSRRTRILLPTHQPGDDMVLVCLFSSRFLAQRDQVASTGCTIRIRQQHPHARTTICSYDGEAFLWPVFFPRSCGSWMAACMR